MFTLGFNIADIQKKYIVIKSIKFIPYTKVQTQDFFVTDGVVVNEELIPVRCRINRVFDVYPQGALVTLLINQTPLPLFTAVGANSGLNLDFFADNIYYLYPEKLQSFDWRILGGVYTDLEAATEGICSLKVVVECYLI